MSDRITVIISQGRSNHPRKRAVEEALVAELLGERGIDVTIVPHLVDLTPHSTGMLCLSGVSGDIREFKDISHPEKYFERSQLRINEIIKHG